MKLQLLFLLAVAYYTSGKENTLCSLNCSFGRGFRCSGLKNLEPNPFFCEQDLVVEIRKQLNKSSCVINEVKLNNFSADEIVKLIESRLLVSVTRLTIENSVLQVFTTKMGSYLPNLAELAMPVCSMKGIEDEAFRPFKDRLELLDLSGNEFKTIPAALSELTALQSLYLMRNKIVKVDLILNSEKLKSLHLSNNNITKIKDGFCSKCESLADLHLNENMLSSFSSEMCPPRITAIYLNSNRLKKTNFTGCFDSRINSTLNLNHNEIRHFPREIFGDKPSLPRKILIEKNPLKCVCELQWLKELSQTNGNWNENSTCKLENGTLTKWNNIQLCPETSTPTTVLPPTEHVITTEEKNKETSTEPILSTSELSTAGPIVTTTQKLVTTEKNTNKPTTEGIITNKPTTTQKPVTTEKPPLWRLITESGQSFKDLEIISISLPPPNDRNFVPTIRWNPDFFDEFVRIKFKEISSSNFSEDQANNTGNYQLSNFDPYKNYLACVDIDLDVIDQNCFLVPSSKDYSLHYLLATVGLSLALLVAGIFVSYPIIKRRRLRMQHVKDYTLSVPKDKPPPVPPRTGAILHCINCFENRFPHFWNNLPTSMSNSYIWPDELNLHGSVVPKPELGTFPRRTCTNKRKKLSLAEEKLNEQLTAYLNRIYMVLLPEEGHTNMAFQG